MSEQDPNANPQLPESPAPEAAQPATSHAALPDPSPDEPQEPVYATDPETSAQNESVAATSSSPDLSAPTGSVGEREVSGESDQSVQGSAGADAASATPGDGLDDLGRTSDDVAQRVAAATEPPGPHDVASPTAPTIRGAGGLPVAGAVVGGAPAQEVEPGSDQSAGPLETPSVTNRPERVVVGPNDSWASLARLWYGAEDFARHLFAHNQAAVGSSDPGVMPVGATIELPDLPQPGSDQPAEQPTTPEDTPPAA